MKNFFFLALIYLGSAFLPSGSLFAHIERTYFLKGTIGGRELVIKMLVYDEMPQRYISYFFRDDKRDKHLTGKARGNDWLFLPDEDSENTASETALSLKIAEADNGNWNGTWTDKAGKGHEVLLSIIPDSISSKFDHLQYVQELDLYDRYKLSDINFVKLRTEKPGNKLVQDWYLEKESGIAFFRVRSAGGQINTDNINLTLESINLALVRDYFSFNPDKIDVKVETNVEYLSNELLSFRILFKKLLQASNTVQTRKVFNYDLKEGKQVNLEDLIWLDKDAEPASSTDLEQVYKYRQEVFAPQLFKMLNNLYPSKMQSDSCELNKVETWVLPAWNLTSTGIAFGFFTLDQCDVLNWAIIPYESLKPFMLSRFELKAIK